MTDSRRLPIAAWTVYGMGSSGYLLMIPTIGYATYFHSQVAGDSPAAAGLWAASVAAALVLAGIIAPWLGAYADSAGRRRPLLGAMTVIACLLTAALALIGPGDIVAGMIVFIAAQMAFLLGKALYDSYLPLLGTAGSLSVVSGLGWGLGYIGSVVVFVLCLPFIAGGAESRDPQTFRLAFLVTGVFFAGLSLSAIPLLPPDPRRRERVAVSSVFGRVAATLSGWRAHREILTFLIAFYVINDAIVTVLSFIGIFFKSTFGLSVEEILRLTLLFYLVGIPATIAFGWLGRVWSASGALQITLVIWIVLIGMLVFGHGPLVPLAVAVVAGLVIGSSQSLCRSIYAAMVPEGRSAEFFGFNALVGRASAALGPLTFGIVTMATGSQRAGMASLAVFIVLGAAILALRRPSAAERRLDARLRQPASDEALDVTIDARTAAAPPS